jgi:hypothetical protein
MYTTADEATRERRLRRAAHRQGLILHKCRARDPRAIGYGLFHITDAYGAAVAGTLPWHYSMTLDGVEGYLTGPAESALLRDDTLNSGGETDTRSTRWASERQRLLHEWAHSPEGRAWAAGLSSRSADDDREGSAEWPRR